MRLALPTYNPIKECNSCPQRDEGSVSAHILSYQIAEQLLRSFPGTVQIGQNLVVFLDGSDMPLHFDPNNGTVRYGTVSTQLVQRYSPSKGLKKLTEEILKDLNLPLEEKPQYPDPLFTVLVKLVEIFHARCGLCITTVESNDGVTTWELRLCENGPRGWMNSEGIIKNRFGEEFNIKEWLSLRPEKVATYVFGFNRFCRHYPSPLVKK